VCVRAELTKVPRHAQPPPRYSEPGAGRAHVVGGLVPRVQELPPALHQK